MVVPCSHGPTSLHSYLLHTMASFQQALTSFSSSLGSVMATLNSAQLVPSLSHPSPFPLPTPSSVGYPSRPFLEPYPSFVSLPVVPTQPSIVIAATSGSALPISTTHQENPKSNLEASTSNVHRLHYKLNHLRSARERGNPVCYRCGDSGHLFNSCRNSLVCFACDRLDHISRICRSITMAPMSRKPPTLDLIEEASRHPPIIFSSNPVNSEFRATLRNSLVLQDSTGLGAIYI
jgi:hypothetical protein